ncbi:MAG: hypothetical protein ACFFDW_01785 [Candidatus Thorarchaeota archaeon]
MREGLGDRIEELSKKYCNPLAGIYSITKKKLTDNLQEKSLHIIIFILLTCIALLGRILIAYYYRENFGTDAIYFWDNQVDFNPNFVYFEGYKDFHNYYVNWAYAWYVKDWYPFQDWRGINRLDPLDMYSYPALFLYILVIFWRPGMPKFWLGFPLMLTDALCAGMVYLILKEIIKKRGGIYIAIFGGVLMAISPINLIYTGVYWLNTGPVTLFVLVCFYFLTQRKWWQTFFWLAIATMCKQDGLFLIYPIFLMMLGEKVRDKGIKRGILESSCNGVVFLFTCVICSIPWIFITPILYGIHMLYPGKMLSLEHDIGDISQVYSFSWALYYHNIRGVFLDIVAFGVNSMLFMIVFATIIAIYMMWRAFYKKMDNIELFEFSAIYIILTHIFLPRGIFKFYTPFYMPFIIIAIVTSLTQFNKRNIALLITLPLTALIIIGFGIWHQVAVGFFIPILLFYMSLLLLALAISRKGFNRIMKKNQKNKLIHSV